MKKYFYLAAASAMMLTACSSENDVVQPTTEPSTPTVVAQQQAVAFDTYLSNTTASTRAGQTGVMNTTQLQTTGFGVFAQYSNGTSTTDGTYKNDPDATSHSIPVANFMWNQAVTYSEGWTYSPLKYWPNETDKDSQTTPATSTHADKLSFFAYAPYVNDLSSANGKGKLDVDGDGANQYDADPAITASGIKTTRVGGIEAVIANNAYGNDPWVRYSVATKPSKSVDLLWGVAPTGNLQYTDVAGNSVDVTAGMPLVDLTKPSKDQKIKFLFQHALARIGMTVVAAINQISAGGDLTTDPTTKIAVKSVEITETTDPKYLKTSGALNLKNTGAFMSLWSNTNGDIDLSVSNDTGGELNPDIAYKTNASTTWNQTGSWKGVTATETPVIAAGKYFMVIPNNIATYSDVAKDVTLKVVITYAVITKDDKLAGGYSEVENVITKEVTIKKFTNNKAYNLKLILGLTSVKLDAEVADWEVDGSTEVYLPQNKEN